MLGVIETVLNPVPLAELDKTIEKSFEYQPQPPVTPSVFEDSIGNIDEVVIQ